MLYYHQIFTEIIKIKRIVSIVLTLDTCCGFGSHSVNNSSSCVLHIGPSLSNMMVNAGLTTFKKIEETNPREIEMVRLACFKNS